MSLEFLADHVQRMLLDQPRSSAEQLAAIKRLYENYGFKNVIVSEKNCDPRVVRVSWDHSDMSGKRSALETEVSE
jgi:hypothetical protein